MTTASGAVHLAAVGVALPVGLLVLLWPKGTPAHVRAGWLFVAAVVAVDVAALLTYSSSGDPGVFHVLAVISLATLVGGVLASPRRRRGSVVPHAVLMCATATGLVAAGAAQLARGQDAWVTALVAVLVCLGGVQWTRRLVSASTEA